MDLILASGSPRRQTLLTRLGLTFRVVPATGVDESAVTGEALSVAKTLARKKAEWSFEKEKSEGQHAGLTVLGADTVVALGSEVLGKPRDAEDASRILRDLSGRVHQVITGVAVIDETTGIRVEAEVSEVRFKDLSDETIRAYVESGDARGKAGAYGIQSGGASLIDGFEGCYYNIVGLPLFRTMRMLGRETTDCDCAGHPLQRGKAGCKL